MFFLSCEKQTITVGSKIVFSEDTVFFDTVFTTIGSTTRELRVRNNSNSKLLIEKIYLAGGNESPFRINIDGEAVLSANNKIIYPHDSIFIFVDVIIDPLNSDLPVLVTDSIIFKTGDTLFKVILHVWGQDITLIKNGIIRDKIWDLPKPYLIYGEAIIDTSQTLIIKEGVRVLFHKNSSLVVAGKIIVSGTREKPVIFASDRIEKQYLDVPGQWYGIFITGISNDNNISYAEIRNSLFGIQLGEPGRKVSSDIPDIKLNCVNISHTNISALAVYYGNVFAANSIFAHSGTHCAYFSSGGNYNFIHCTFYNRWEYGVRFTPLLYITDKPLNALSPTGTINLNMFNCVVYGDLSSEIQIITDTSNPTVSYFFDHCYIRVDTASSYFCQHTKFPGVIVNKDPKFIKESDFDFRPDTLSPLINAGNRSLVNVYPEDFRGASRLTDGLPDMGAYERIAGEKKLNR
ncbi:MAG: choice-of-anchor Q domain-containing protein [Bacteroidales bacterium]